MASVAVPPVPISGAAGALNPDQVRELLEAQARVSKLRRAANVARFDGWTVGFFAAITILTGFTSASALLLGTGMAIVAYVEFDGATKLRRLFPHAPRRLAINQACLGTMLILYALWQLYVGMSTASHYATLAGGDPQMAKMLAPVESITRAVTIAVYVTLIAVAISMQGGTALYYLSRQKLLEQYVRATPKWILDLQRAGVAV
jgi:hypothetical protein